MNDSLFTPVRLGAIEAPNRILMVPLTRGRATADGVPTPIMIEYYRQRASAGLIIGEATAISREGLGWPAAPGIWSAAQVEAWKPVTAAVHEAGGRIILQLWHMGRLVHPDFNDGKPPVSASATLAPEQAWTPVGKKSYVPARALSVDEIARVVDDYGAAARNARAAGFDGVQLHGATGYLIDQFIRDNSNLRDDDYGGSPKNRVRLLGEVTERLCAEWGPGLVSVRLSPNGESQGCDDSQPSVTFGAAARVLQGLGVGFVEVRQPGPDSTLGKTIVPQQDALIRSIYTGPVVLNSDYTPERAAADVSAGRCDAVSFGRPFISNPDLPARIRLGAQLAENVGVPETWYFPGEHGYIDYPTLAEAGAA